MRKIISLTLLIWSGSVVAQQHSPVFTETHSGNTIGVFGGYNATSNAITAKFMNTFYSGGHIDQDIKQKAYDKLNNKNRLGIDADFGLYYLHRSDTNNSGFFFAFKNRLHADMLFKPDLFKTYFSGNKQFAGETAELGPSQIQLISYRQLQGGFVKTISKSSGDIKIGAGLSFLQGLNHLNIDLERGQLYTDPEGLYLDLNTKFEIRESPHSKSFSYWNGAGGSLDFYISKSWENSSFTVEITDLGMIKWNEKAQTTTNDTSLTFEGFEVDNLFNVEDSLLVNLNGDSILNEYGTRKRTGSYSSLLPAFIHFSYAIDLNEKWTLQPGLVYRMQANYFPYVYVNGNYRHNEMLSLKTRLAYGGYGTLQVGLGLGMQFGDHVQLNVFSQNIEGYILSNATTGQGVFLSLNTYF